MNVPIASHIKFSQYFNNKNLSDCQLFFAKSQTTLFLHRFILMASSDFFRACFEHDMIESREGIVRIEEDDERLMTNLIKSLYTDQLWIEDKKEIVPMILLTQKYQLISLIPILIDHLVSNIDRTNILQCFRLDWEQDQFKQVEQEVQQQFRTSSDEILKGDSYLTLNVEQWMSALEMIVDKSNGFHAYNAINSWIEVDVENRAQYCYALSSTVKKAVHSNENTKSSKLSFDPQFIGSRITLSDYNKRIKKSEEVVGFNCALGMKCDSFSIRLIKNCTNLMIGMAPRTIDKDGENYSSCGWYFYCRNGRLYSQRGDNSGSYSNKSADQDGSVIGVSLKNGELSFSVNGEDLGVAFRGLHSLDLYPAVDLRDSGCELEFV